MTSPGLDLGFPGQIHGTHVSAFHYYRMRAKLCSNLGKEENILKNLHVNSSRHQFFLLNDSSVYTYYIAM